MEARWHSRKLEEFGALRNERVHQKENNPGICAPVGALEPSRFRCGPRQHILAVIMLYERLRRKEFLREYCQWGALILAEELGLVAARLGEIDGTDKCDRYQNG